jgi:hypothetical protein
LDGVSNDYAFDKWGDPVASIACWRGRLVEIMVTAALAPR